MKLSVRLFASLFLFSISATAADVPGSSDVLGLKRYEGAEIIGYRAEGFGELTYPASRIIFDSGKIKSGKLEHAEGKHTRLLYRLPIGRSTLEVVRNYRNDLTAAGAKVIWECATAACENTNTEATPDGRWYAQGILYDQPHILEGGAVTTYAFGGPRDARYLAMRVPPNGPNGERLVSIYAAIEGSRTIDANAGHMLVLVDVIEKAQMDQRMVLMTADKMAADIASSGKVALYGIYFDTGKSELKPESDAVLKEIGKLLSGNAALKLLVVGHTDNVGSFDSNLDLSQRRSAAVAKEIATRFNVPAARLRGLGVASASPVASNDTEEGRAKNRRVELVRQ